MNNSNFGLKKNGIIIHGEKIDPKTFAFKSSMDHGKVLAFSDDLSRGKNKSTLGVKGLFILGNLLSIEDALKNNSFGYDSKVDTVSDQSIDFCMP